MKIERLVRYGSRTLRNVIEIHLPYTMGTVLKFLIFKLLSQSHSAADCSISLTFTIEFDHVTADTLQMFKVKGSTAKVTW